MTVFSSPRLHHSGYANTEESRQLIEESRRKRMGVPAEDIHLSFDDDFEEEFSDEDIDDEDDEDADGGEAEVTQEEPQKINDNENKEDK